MSPIDHESYLNLWAQHLRVPIVSVNYRKAPEYPYPAGFNDCFDTYKALLDSHGAIIGIDNAHSDDMRFALAGDSAGGNFVAAVCLRAIAEGIRIPNGLLMAYPILDSDMQLFKAVTYKEDYDRNFTSGLTYYSDIPSQVYIHAHIQYTLHCIIGFNPR